MWIISKIKNLLCPKEPDGEVKWDIEELLELEDRELIEKTIFMRVEPILSALGYGFISHSKVPEPMWIAYSVFDFMELAIDKSDSGIRSFLGSCVGEYTVLRASDSLEKIGAWEYKKVFDDFIMDNNIDLTDLSQFKQQYGNKDVNEAAGLYSFEETDKKIHSLSGVEKYLAKYIRENIGVFFEV